MGLDLKVIQARWERYQELTVSKPTAAYYRNTLYTFVDAFPDIKDPSQFTRADIEDWKIQRLRAGYSPAYVNSQLNIIGSFFKYCNDMDYLEWNPVDNVKRVKQPEIERKSYTLDEQERILKSVSEWGKPQDILLARLALSTGLRAATLVRVETSDVDWETSTLRISGTKMKTGRNHAVPLREVELELLRQIPEGPIFKGYANTPRMMVFRWQQICKRAQVKCLGMRGARRSFATTLLRKGVDLGIVQNLLAHKNIVTTSRYITPADSETTKKAIDLLPK